MPHIEQLVVQNYRVLKEITLDDLQPMSVVLDQMVAENRLSLTFSASLPTPCKPTSR